MSPALAEVTLGAVDLFSERGQRLDEVAPALGLPIDFQVPKGCVVRNTFLEWAEEDGCALEAGALLCPHEAFSPSSQRRPRSCPPQPDRARRLVWRSAADEEASTTDEELSSSATACATPDRSRELQGEAAGALGGAEAAEPPPPAPPGAVERRGPAAPAAEKPECDEDVIYYRRVKPPSAGPQDAQAWQVRAPQAPWQGHAAGAAAAEAHAHARTPKGATAKGSLGRACIVLRGLPFDATEADVVDFIGQHGGADALASAEPVCLVANPQGKPSGFAEVRLNSRANYLEVQGKLHMQRLGDRYIEALPPSSRSKASPRKPPAQRGSRWSDGGRRDAWRQM